MRSIAALLVLGCALTLCHGQYVEATILLSDSLSGMTSVGSLVSHAPTNTIYVGGDERFLVAVDARTNAKSGRVTVGTGPHVLCSDPTGNKIYCANQNSTITVIDGATNQPVETIQLGRNASDLCYNGRENKLYVGNAGDGYVRVIDCAGDSVVARVPVSFGPGALCYNPQLNRIYCAHKDRDEVSVIDCSADTCVRTVWVRGARPQDICYDSATNCVYTSNASSSTVSVIDCESDTLKGLIAVGREPVAIIAGPPGKVYCANHGGGSVSAISSGAAKTMPAVSYPRLLSFDSVNGKVYCAGESQGVITVIDVVGDTALSSLAVGSYAAALCHNPAGNNTYVACSGDDITSVVGGVSDSVEVVIPFRASRPGPMCYNTVNNHLYCLDSYRGSLFVIDGDSSRVLRALQVRTGDNGVGSLIWNPASNKVYFCNSYDDTVSVLDCTSDTIIAMVETGYGTSALCCSDEGKVYAAAYGVLAVIDGFGDTLRGIVPAGYDPVSLCYDRTDNKVYVGRTYQDSLAVIDAHTDSAVASIPVLASSQPLLCWNQNHDKVYSCAQGSDSLTVIDCVGDTILGNVSVRAALKLSYSDSVCDKVYCASSDITAVILATIDSLSGSLDLGQVSAMIDNGKQGPANRLYCTDYGAGRVAVVSGYKTDSILCHLNVGSQPSALAWNPTHSRVYVSNSGSSSISVIRDTIGVGVEEKQPQASCHKPQATVVRGSLELRVGSRPNTGYRAELLDVGGRRVMELKLGANDVRQLAPGVYFVREEPQTSDRLRVITKVVIAR